MRIDVKILVLLLLSLLTVEITKSQCELIVESGSDQSPDNVCAPVHFTMEVSYKFLIPVNPSLIDILFVWNDGYGSTTTVNGIPDGTTQRYTATASFTYPAHEACSYTAEAFLIYNGNICTSSSRQEQTFSSWGTDEENGAVLQTDPPVAQFCEGDEIVDVVFDDNSVFNCNINIEPDKPNRINRWVQFIYGTQTIPGDRIPNITIVDEFGNTVPLTDAAGNSLGTYEGPIVEIPLFADGPNQSSYPISAPAGGVAGDIFEITMRNWNICNPYDDNPWDANPPTDLINGDNPPITTTALIEIITTPPEISNPSSVFCVNSPILISVPNVGDETRWYSDSLLTNLIYTGENFDPTLPPVNLDNAVPGSHTFYVTTSIMQCESAPTRVDIQIFDEPTPSNAGIDSSVCQNNIQLYANTPLVGTGEWTTSSGATIIDVTNPVSTVINLDPGPNVFTWTITNGPCVSQDQVIIYSDLQPSGAVAGLVPDLCNISTYTLSANSPTNNGKGEWSVYEGSGTFDDKAKPDATVSGLAQGYNRLVWEITSQYNACLPSSDTVTILRDVQPAPAHAGSDEMICEIDTFNLNGNPATNGGSGVWSIVTGVDQIFTPDAPSSEVLLVYGMNELEWSISSEYGICPSTSDRVVYTVYEQPQSADAGPDQDLCDTLVSDPLQGNSGEPYSYEWKVIDSPNGILPSFSTSETDSNTVLTILPGEEGRYFLTWEIVNGTCISVDTVAVDFGHSPSQAIAGPDKDECGTSIMMSANNPAFSYGTWAKLSGPGDVIFLPSVNDSNAIVSINPGDEGLYLLEWSATSGSCPTSLSNRDTVMVNFRVQPSEPSVRDTFICGNGSLNIPSGIGLRGDHNLWYDNAVGGNLLYTGTNFNTGLLTGTTTYYVSTINLVSGCESPRVPVVVNVYPVPDDPIAIDQSSCGPSSFTLSGLTGNNGTTVRWYQDQFSSIIINIGNIYLTPLLNTSRTYWITNYNEVTTCESQRVEINAEIFPIPGEPILADTSRCGSGSMLLTSIPGTNATTTKWYGNDSIVAHLITGVNFLTPGLTDTTIYYASSLNELTNCESDRSDMEIVIHPLPLAPVLTDMDTCGASTIELNTVLNSNATTNIWYNSPGGSTVLDTGLVYSEFLTMNKTFWVSGFNEITGCESSRSAATVIINEIPNTSDIQGAELVALNQTNVIYSVDYHLNSTYNWIIPPPILELITFDNINILEFPFTGNYTIGLIETSAEGCSGPLKEKQIQIVQEAITLNLSSYDTSTCINNNLALQVVPQGGTPLYKFEWTGDTTWLDATDIPNPVFNCTTEGDFKLYISVSDLNNVEVTDSIHILVNPNPVAQILTPDSTLCVGDSVLVDVETTGGAGVYKMHYWTGTTVGLNNIFVARPYFKTLADGVYPMVYNVIDQNGCTASDSMVLSASSPKAMFSSDAKPACSPLNVNFVNQSGNDLQYTWNFKDGTVSIEENPSHTFRNHSTGLQYFDVNLTVSDSMGCTDSTNQLITVYPNPPQEIKVDPDVACHPANTFISADPGAILYSWEFGDGISDFGGYNAFHRYTNYTDRDTTYRIRLVTISFFACYDTSYRDLVVHPSPKGIFTVNPEERRYPETSFMVKNLTGSEEYSYAWNMGDGMEFDALYEPGEYEYEERGVYKITMYTSSGYCTDSVFKYVRIEPPLVKAAFTPPESGCMPLTVEFKNSSEYAHSFLWEFGDGSVSNSPEPTYTYYEFGKYKITLTAMGEGGVDTDTATTSVYILPNSYFDLAPRQVFVNDEAVHYFNLSDNGDVYEWDFGDGNTSNEFNPTHIYKEEGTFTVKLTVWTENNCFDIFEQTNAVDVRPAGKIEYPNAIRPTSEVEENRVFTPGIIDNVLEYHLRIYNRWGELIFESMDQEIGWDGTFMGKPVKSDVYIWKVTGKYSNGDPYVKTGDVTVLY